MISAEAPYRSGLGASGGGAKVTVVSHLRQAKVSNCGLSLLDLLPSIATPQSGQC
jgi:hypothetical protein